MPMQAHKGDGGIAPTIRNLDAKRWLVRTKPRPLYLRQKKKPGTHCTEGWVGLEAGLEGYGKSHPHRVSIPGPSSP